MAEITNEQKLYVLLKYKKERTKKEEKILSILNEKANLGSADLEEADKECCNQKWLSPIHVVEELGYTTKYSHRIELSESGKSQIEKFWRESKYNPDNVWKSRVVKWSSVVTAIITLIYFLAWLCQLVQKPVEQ
nr:MAG TPA: hypothetical protein [Caudoviricetes sp.]